MFSKTYLKQPAGQAKDSERLRTRIARRAWDQTRDSTHAREMFARRVEQETGADVPSGMDGYSVDKFFRNAPMRDVLDGITCMASALRDQAYGGEADVRSWIEFCQRAFTEEGMAYRIDVYGEAHYQIDVVFHELADSVISVLSREPYAAAGACMNKAVEEMTRAQPDGKDAIRDVFEGVESVFKVTTATNKDLTAANISAVLSPIVNRRFAVTDVIAQGAAQQTLEALKDWTNACHKYRHGHNAEEPVEPPVDLAVVLVGNGLNFARWIATFST